MSDDSKKPPPELAGTMLAPPTAPPDAATVVPPGAAAVAGIPASPSGVAPAAPGQRTAQVGAGEAPFRHTLAGQPEVDRVIGQVLAGYEVIRQLAEGGMGVVYEGRHAKLGRRGAIKLLKPEYCQSEPVVERFYQEARAVNEIHHENIVDIYDFGRSPDGRVFFVMEYLEGESLGARLSRGPLTFADAMFVLEPVIRALQAAHDKGFAHRDLKPDNIWLKRRDDGGAEVRLLDFGIAKLVGLENVNEKLTRTGAIIGTPMYMSPEQINGEQTLDARTDIYSLGIIMYELFTGVTPFRGDSLAAIMTGHLFNEAPRLAGLPPELGVPDAVGRVIERMLAKRPDERYASISDVLSDLRDVAQHREPMGVSRLDREKPRSIAGGVQWPGEPAPTPPPMQPPRPAPVAAPAARSRRGLIIPIAAVATIGLAAGGYALLGPGKKSADAPAVAPAPGPATAADPSVPTPGPAVPAPAAPALDLAQAGSDARAVLRESLGNSEPRVRVHGSDGVAAIKDRASEPRLLELATVDPDLEVRGHAASALGALGADAHRAVLAKEEKNATPPLKVWYAGALARLGDRDARKRLYKYSKDRDLAVAFRAALQLADVSPGGDRDAIKALTRLAEREAELNDVAPYAGAVLLGKLAALRDERARPILYQLIENGDERTRLAAAEGLARLGDEAALAPLERTLDDPASSNRLVAAVALIPLGEYRGFDLLSERLADPDPEMRRLAARGLGEIGEKRSVEALLPLLKDPDGSVRVAGAVAVVFVVGLDPVLLAQSSVDWARGALASEDWAVRSAGAGVLGDLPEESAAPLLAAALVDREPRVRRSAARSSGKLEGPEIAKVVADAALAEADPEVKADQVRALGALAEPTTVTALTRMSEDPGVVGVLASGSRIAAGDAAGKDRLMSAIADAQVAIRAAAVEGAVLARNPIAVPVLASGARDRVFAVRFASAEGLAQYKAEQDLATVVLAEGLKQRDPSMQGRARAALLGFGQSPVGGASAEQLLDSPDAATRQIAAYEIAHLSWSQARPLVRRMLADPDAGVRARGLDLVESGGAQRDDAVKLYKTAVDDADPGVRAKAQGRLARLTSTPAAVKPAPAPVPAPTPAPTPAATPDAAPATPTPSVDEAAVQTARDEATAAAAELEKITKDMEVALATPADDDRDIRKVKDLARSARPIRDRLAALKQRAAAAAAKAGTDTAREAAAEVEKLAAAAKDLADELDKKADEYAASETGDIEMRISAADAAIASGKFSDAERDLDKAAAQASAAGQSYPAIKFSYGRLYDGMAKRARDPADKLPLLQKAKRNYDAFASSGSGSKVSRARARSAELAEEIAELEAEAP